MQLQSIVRFGSLAFNVAQDQKVQELVTMIHKGAKRRGMLQAPNVGLNSQPSNATAVSKAVGHNQHPIPFAPKAASQGSTNVPAPATPNLKSWMTLDNAKRAIGVAGIITEMFSK